MRYGFGYDADGPYGRIVALLGAHVPVGTVVDIGCGNAAIAEPLRDLGYGYIGVDLDSDTVAAVRARGWEAHQLDLSRDEELADAIAALAAGRTIVAFTALDVIEHLPAPRRSLRAIHAAMTRTGAEWLGVSIPNVAHVDLGLKLLSGRWDVTPTGLLDDTHISLYTEARLRADTSATGFEPGPADDFHRDDSDQAFPSGLLTLSRSTPLSRLLRSVRARADIHATTNQFVRLFRRGAAPEAPESDHHSTLPDVPFLTVLVPCSGLAELRDLAAELSRQTVTDFEVVVLSYGSEQLDLAAVRSAFDQATVERVRLEVVDGGARTAALAHGVAVARGLYVSVAEPRFELGPDWVEQFLSAAVDEGPIVHSGIGGVTESLRFDFGSNLRAPRTPLATVAIPRAAFTQLGIGFDPAFEALEGLDVVLLAATWCGVVDTEAFTVLQRSANEEAFTAAQQSVVAELLALLDAAPLLLPEGSATRLLSTPARSEHPTRAVDADATRQRVLASLHSPGALQRFGAATRTEILVGEIDAQRGRAEAAEVALAAMERSRVWRATKPVRWLMQLPLIRRTVGRLVRVLRR